MQGHLIDSGRLPPPDSDELGVEFAVCVLAVPGRPSLGLGREGIRSSRCHMMLLPWHWDVGVIGARVDGAKRERVAGGVDVTEKDKERQLSNSPSPLPPYKH